jgi:hypothetical protein
LTQWNFREKLSSPPQPLTENLDEHRVQPPAGGF